jgi:uncharacterized iron-regulated membrane protein
MKPRKLTYVVHRWIALVVSLQLLAWSLGGFIFSVLSIESVRGEHEIGAPEFDPLPASAIEALPGPARELFAQCAANGVAIGSVALADRGLGSRWELRSVRGELVAAGAARGGQIAPEDAARLALRDFGPETEVTSTALIVADPPTEYRNGSLPVYQVALSNRGRTRLYVDARSGRINARRNTRWRVFDFFWMLHTMDYRGRDDFNHPLLTAFSLVAIATSLSGLLLWAWRARGRLGRPAPPLR